MTRNVTIVHVPQVSTCPGSLAVSFSCSPNRMLTVSCSLTACSACNKRWNSEVSSTQTDGRLPHACRAATRPRVSAATTPKARQCSKGPSTSPFFCSTIFGHWCQPNLFNVRQVSMFPRRCRVAWEETARPPRALPSTQSFQSNFSRQL